MIIRRIDVDDTNSRLDHWLVKQFPDRSRSELQRWIRDGNVLVDDVPTKPSHRLETSQTVTVTIPATPLEPTLVPQPIPLDIVYEDSDLVVVNKPAGMVVHPAPGHAQDTLVNAVLHHCPDIQGIGGEMRPGIVHRLDKDTSGLMIVAKNDSSLRFLQRQFKDRTIAKRYVALLEGRIVPDRGRISVPLGRHPVHRKRQAAYPSLAPQSSSRVREAITEYQTLGEYTLSANYVGGPAVFTLVEALLRTGRTHQLRVHFAWMKHPIVGDTIYGYRKKRLVADRLFLHSQAITLIVPSSGERLTLTAPLPAALTDMLERLTPS